MNAIKRLAKPADPKLSCFLSVFCIQPFLFCWRRAPILFCLGSRWEGACTPRNFNGHPSARLALLSATQADQLGERNWPIVSSIWVKHTCFSPLKKTHRREKKIKANHMGNPEKVSTQSLRKNLYSLTLASSLEC
jgi:hypothetical protein